MKSVLSVFQISIPKAWIMKMEQQTRHSTHSCVQLVYLLSKRKVLVEALVLVKEHFCNVANQYSFVSTCNKDNIHHFEGVTRLCSHVINGHKYSHMGFYDNNNGQPTNDVDRIPMPFKRKEAGTSIGIMGIERAKWNESKIELAKEVLSNFFVAVLKGKLVVYIDGNQDSHNGAIIINSDTIKGLMETYFPTTKDVRRRGSFNPRPYFEAMTNSEIPPFVADLETVGHVELYLKEFDKM